MTQQELGLNRSTRRTRKAVFLDEMSLVVPWTELLSLIAPHAPRAKTGRPPFQLVTMLRIHFLQQWFGLSDLAIEEALFETTLYREFAGLSSGERDPEMHQTKKGNQRHFGMKAHIGVDADSGLVHTVVGTAVNVNDVTQASAWVHAEEADVFADAGYQGVSKREEVQGIEANWHVSMRPGKRRALNKDTPMGAVLGQLEHVKAHIRARVEHPFRVIKRQFCHVKVRYRGLAKNTAQLHTLFALSNLRMARRRLLQGLQV